jgi:NADH:ubiquinone oxidoreductase subunit E
MMANNFMVDEILVEQVVQEVINKHGTKRSALVAILKDINEELGFLPPSIFGFVGQRMDIPVGEVYSVASFYTMLSMEPRGRHLVLFCESAPCHIAGGKELEHELVTLLGVGHGGTSADGRWTLLKTSCLGHCAEGPIVVIDDDIYGPVTKNSLSGLLEKYD